MDDDFEKHRQSLSDDDRYLRPKDADSLADRISIRTEQTTEAETKIRADAENPLVIENLRAENQRLTDINKALTSQVEAMREALVESSELLKYVMIQGRTTEGVVVDYPRVARLTVKALASLEPAQPAIKCPKHDTGGGPCYCKPAQGGGE